MQKKNTLNPASLPLPLLPSRLLRYPTSVAHLQTYSSLFTLQSDQEILNEVLFSLSYPRGLFDISQQCEGRLSLLLALDPSGLARLGKARVAWGEVTHPRLR